MRIEKVDENRIRIFLNLEDLEEKNIDLHTFMSSSIESQDLFLDMLNEAESKLGFKTKNYKLIIEALASSDGTFIFTITRERPDILFNKSKIKQPMVRRKQVVPNKPLSIYCFNSFDEFCEFCNYLNNNINLNNALSKFKNTSLVLFKNKYYLLLNSLKLDCAELNAFSCIASEFASFVKNEFIVERKLKEYGSVIIGKNAISVCLKFFSTK